MKINNSLSKILFYLAYGLWISAYLIGYTMYPITYPIIGSIATILTWLSIGILFIKLLTDRYFSYRTILLAIAIVVFLAIVGYSSGQLPKMLFFGLILVASKNINLKKVLKLHAYLLIGTLAITYLGVKLDIIQNISHVARGGEFIRKYVGFRFPTFGANTIFHLICIWGYVRGKLIKYWEILLLAIINYYYFTQTDTKSAYYLAMGYLILILVVKIFRIEKLPKLIVSIIEQWSIPVVALVSVLLIQGYAQRNSFNIALNELLTGRLQLGLKAIRNYGMSLFGNRIVWNTYDLYGRSQGEYLYVDASFLNILLQFGILFLTTLIFSYWMLFKRNPYSNIYYSISFFGIVVHSMWDPQFLELWFNPFLLFISVLVSQSSEDIEIAKLESCA